MSEFSNDKSHSHSEMVSFSCTSRPDDLDRSDPLIRTPEHTSACKAAFDPKSLWEMYGIIDNVIVSLPALIVLRQHPSLVFI